MPIGNSHAARALVAEPQNALSIAHHDAAHIVVALVRENLIDPVAIGIADEQSARPSPDFREALASFAHRRRVDNRQQLFGVVLDHRVEQRLVVVLKIAHVAVLAESRLARIEHALAAQPLILKRADMRRQQSVQPEDVALLFGECGALVQPRVEQQIDAVQARAND